MTQYTVGTTPESIYPDGLQTPLTISNGGPYTVYCDESSSVSDRSHAIPPNGRLVWDGGRKLFLCASGNSSVVTINRNGATSQSDTLHTITPLVSVADALSVPVLWNSPIMETSSYESLVISFNDPSNVTTVVTANNYINVRVYYLYQNGSTIPYLKRADYFVPCGGMGNTYSQLIRVTVPVLSSYMQVQLTPPNGLTNATLPLATLRIDGMSRALPESVTFLPRDAIWSNDSSLNPALLAGNRHIVLANYDKAVSPNIYINAVAPYLTIALAFPSPITTAGSFRVRNMITNTGYYDLPVPADAGGNVRYTGKVAVPVSAPILAFGSGYATTGAPDVSFTWTDS